MMAKQKVDLLRRSAFLLTRHTYMYGLARKKTLLLGV